MKKAIAILSLFCAAVGPLEAADLSANIGWNGNYVGSTGYFYLPTDGAENDTHLNTGMTKSFAIDTK